MKTLKIAATVTSILGFFSVIALVFLYLALSDIANHEPDQTLEWYVAGICLIVLCAFTLSTLITMARLFKTNP
jgi:uncharacterized membrane protein